MIFDLAHSFVNIFAGGESDTKTIIFFIYFLFLVVLYIIFKNYRFKNLKWKWFGFSLGLTYIYGLVLYIVYLIINNLSLTSDFISGANGEVSSSIIWHIHIAKAFIGQILTYFGKTDLQTIDAGGAFIGAFSQIIFLLGSLLLIILIFQAVLYFITSFQNLLKNKNKRQIFFLIVTYSIVSLSLIKTSIDGGMFSRGFYLGGLFISLFILQEKKKLPEYFYYLLSILGILLSGISFFLYYFKFDYLNLSAISALFLLYVFLFYGTKKKINKFVLALLFIFFLSAWWVYSPRDRFFLNYANTYLPVGSHVYIYNEKTSAEEIIKIEHAQTVRELAKNLNKNINYLPIAAEGINCQASTPKFSFSITLISDKPLREDSFTGSKDIIIRNLSSQPFYNKWKTKLGIFLNPCLRETLTIINGELIKNNINNYLLIDGLAPRNSNNLW